MSKPTTAIVSVNTPTGQLIDLKTGYAIFSFTKWLQNIGSIINNAFDNQGALSPDSIPFPTSTALGGVTTAGPEAHEWINAIDSTGTPQLSQPNFTDIAGTATPAQVPSISALGGTVTPAQVPPLSELAGAVTAAQTPPLQDLGGAITNAQLPAGLLGITATIITAQLTPLGSQGSQTFVDGILKAQVPAT